MRKLIFLVLSLLLLVACGNDDSSYSGSPTPSPARAMAIIDTGDEVVLVDVEVADSDEERALGLMNRESLDEDKGMLFLYFEPNRGGFWMKDTLIPLSIAFFDEKGEILKIMDMEPCENDPCPTYDPGVRYWGALEVNQGAFEKWGVSEGDTLRTNQ
jgi:uncharacterized membrane protein (UPF0127 family)